MMHFIHHLPEQLFTALPIIPDFFTFKAKILNIHIRDIKLYRILIDSLYFHTNLSLPWKTIGFLLYINIVYSHFIAAYPTSWKWMGIKCSFYLSSTLLSHFPLIFLFLITIV